VFYSGKTAPPAPHVHDDASISPTTAAAQTCSLTVTGSYCSENALEVQQLLLEPLLATILLHAWLGGIAAVASAGASSNTHGWCLTITQGQSGNELLLRVAATAEAAGQHPANRG